MPDIVSLGIKIETAQVASASSVLEKLAASGGKAEKSTDALSKSFSSAEKSAGAMSSAASSLQRTLGALSVTLVAKDIIQNADAYSNLISRMKLVTTSAQELTDAQGALFAVSQKTRTGYEQTADLFGSLSRSTKSLGVSQKEVVGVTESINKALIISGTSASSAAAALVQLGQGFASGVLRGDELNSVLEQAPRLAQALADGLGVPVGKLRALGEAGELTADKVFSAFQKSAAAIDSEFKKIPTTIAGSLTQVQNAVLLLVGTLDQADKSSSSSANGITVFANAIEGLANKIKLASDEGRNSLGVFARITGFGKALGLTFGDTNAEKVAALSTQVAALDGVLEKGNITEAHRNLLLGERLKLLSQINGLPPGGKRPDGDTFDQMEAKANATFNLQASGRQANATALLKEYATNATKLAAAIKDAKAKTGEFYSPELDKLLNDHFADKGAANRADALSKAQSELSLANIKAQLDARNNTYRIADSILAAQRQAGLVTDKQYFDRKRELIELDEANELRGLAVQKAELESRRFNGPDAAKKTLDNQREIVEVEAKMAKAREETAGKFTILTTQQTAGLQAVTMATQAAKDAASEYLATLTLQSQRAIAAVGLSDKDRDFNSGLSAIEDKYTKQRTELENRRKLLTSLTDGTATGNRFNADEQRKYNEELANITTLQSKELDIYKATYAGISAEESKWQNGASRAFENYANAAANASRQTEQFFGNALKGMEDSLVSFITTGKGGFKQFASSIIAELVRIQVQTSITSVFKGSSGSSIFGSILGAFGGTGAQASVASALPGDSLDNFLKLTGLTGKATGGPVSAGTSYLVGEKGPEILQMGPMAGNIIPNNQIGAGGGFTQTVNMQIGSNISRTEVASAVQQGMRAVKGEISEMLRVNKVL